MKILVAGCEGLIGTRLVELLQAEGDEVVPFDRRRGQDVLDEVALLKAMRGCDAVVHLAAVVDPGAGAVETLGVNLRGTANVLGAVRGAGAQRVVFASSVNALGIFRGEGSPEYLPLDDDHPCQPKSPYGVSKLRAEDLCERLTASTGIATVCLRPPAVWDDGMYARIDAARAADPAFEWSPYWEYGAFLDVRDCASACARALRCEDPGHVRLLLCAPDVSSAGASSLELAGRLLPDVPIRDPAYFREDPYRALVDTRRAGRLLDWTPLHAWREWKAGRPA